MSQLPEPDAPVIHVHSKQRGRLDPMSRRELARMLDKGDLAETDLAWYNGLASWTPISDIPQITTFLAANPPKPAPAPAPEPAPAAQPAAAGISNDIEATTAQEGALVEATIGSADDDRLDEIFGDLVEQSWKFHHQHDFATHIDEVMVGDELILPLGEDPSGEFE